MGRASLIHPSQRAPHCELVLNEQIHAAIMAMLPEADRFVWVLTADIKDMHVRKGQSFVPFLQILAELIDRGVGVRLFHAKEPGPRFREHFDAFPALVESELFERVLCPRLHTKAIIVDGRKAFIGSANLTGAGMGAKHRDKRNFEAGFVTNRPEDLEPLVDWVDQLYLGQWCHSCRRREHCPDPIA